MCITSKTRLLLPVFYAHSVKYIAFQRATGFSNCGNSCVCVFVYSQVESFATDVEDNEAMSLG